MVLIVGVNGKPVNNEQDLHNAEGLLPIGSDVELKVMRDGREIVAKRSAGVGSFLGNVVWVILAGWWPTSPALAVTIAVIGLLLLVLCRPLGRALACHDTPSNTGPASAPAAH